MVPLLNTEPPASYCYSSVEHTEAPTAPDASMDHQPPPSPPTGQRKSTTFLVMSWIISAGLGVLLAAMVKIALNFLLLS